MLYLQTSVHQVQDPKYVINHQTQIIVEFYALVYRVVKTALEMNKDNKKNVNY